ncbi:MAG: EAL domain-containing protein [Lachnospiraceae bacterium]|nr:EAL domain-containing protein [Lachnospiraceae bacterium]
MLNKLNYLDGIHKTILVVDDEFVGREILGAILGGQYNIIYAENGEEALQMIRNNEKILSAVLLDLMMPVMDGFEVLDVLKEDARYRSIPVIVLTSEKQAEVESLKRGAADFITKPYDTPEVIIARVRRIIELSEKRLVIQSTERDELTGLFTRTFFYEYAMLMDRYHSDREMDSVSINIEHFHLVNEIHGREFGDWTLRILGEAIRDHARENEGIAARGDSDDFYMYINHQENYDVLEKRLKEALSELSGTAHIKVRIGVYSSTADSRDVVNRFDRARLAANTLRGKFNQTVAYFDQDLKHKVFFEERLINDIHEGIDTKQFEVYFQPKYDITGEKPTLSAAEALIRWRHPEFGMISPGDFVSLFEENGLIQMVDRFVWKETVSSIRHWKDTYGITLPVSVNVSRIDIYDPDIEKRIDGLIKEYGLLPKDLHLEITESAYSDNAAQMMEVVQNFREKGYLIEMDDFGAGYSSLNMLANLPIDVLKLDMKFIQEIHKDKRSLRMVQLIMDIAGFLGVPVVAEGVELEEQYKLLKETGYQLIQGYYFSRPVPAHEFEELIKEEQDKRRNRE